MTCSVLDPENDAQAQAFLRGTPGFAQAVRHLWTPLDASDGFFLSLLIRA